VQGQRPCEQHAAFNPDARSRKQAPATVGQGLVTDGGGAHSHAHACSSLPPGGAHSPSTHLAGKGGQVSPGNGAQVSPGNGGQVSPVVADYIHMGGNVGKGPGGGAHGNAGSSRGNVPADHAAPSSVLRGLEVLSFSRVYNCVSSYIYVDPLLSLLCVQCRIAIKVLIWMWMSMSRSQARYIGLQAGVRAAQSDKG
jgi:hypothetical protein